MRRRVGPAFSRHSLWYNVGEPKRGAERSTTLDIVHYIYAIGSGHLEWLVYAASLLCSVLPDALVAYRRGFGMRGFRFGRRRGSLRLFRLLFVLLFTTALGPIVLVALVAYLAYRFFRSRRAR